MYKQVSVGIGIVTLILAIFLGGNIVETNKKGYYQIKQAAFSGKMTARMTPGMYLQAFGDIQTWPIATTFFFTADSEGDENDNQSIEVRFNDGSMTNLSGTIRIVMPTSPKQVIELVTKNSYINEKDLMGRLLRPHVRNALRNMANLMSAKESYTDRRAEFISGAWDQIQNGIYQTTTKTTKTIDPLTKEEEDTLVTVVKTDKDGNKLYEKSPMDGLGIEVANFEIKQFLYPKKVNAQIAEQQTAIMGVQTAMANALKAEQDKKTTEEQGKAKVMAARYEKEQIKVQAVVEAQKEKEVAELHALKELEVAKLQKQAAVFEKQKLILQGEGESTKKRLIMQADGALKQKLNTYEKVMGKFAEEFGKQRWVSEINFTSGNNGKRSGSSNEATALIDLLTVKAAKDLSLNLKVPTKE